MKPTAHVLYFTHWSNSELRRIQHPNARLPLAKWQLKGRERNLWILTHLDLFIHAAKFRPDGYELLHQGEVIETGRFSWEMGRPERVDVVSSLARSEVV